MPIYSAHELLLLLRRAEASDGEWPSGLVAAINATDDPAVYHELATLLANEPEDLRATAARALGAAGNPEALETLAPLLEDASAKVRFQAAWAVADFGAVQDMIPALSLLIAGDGDPQTRLLAVQALFIVRDHPDARKALEVAASDPDASVGDAARRMLSAKP